MFFNLQTLALLPFQVVWRHKPCGGSPSQALGILHFSPSINKLRGLNFFITFYLGVCAHATVLWITPMGVGCLFPPCGPRPLGKHLYLLPHLVGSKLRCPVYNPCMQLRKLVFFSRLFYPLLVYYKAYSSGMAKWRRRNRVRYGERGWIYPYLCASPSQHFQTGSSPNFIWKLCRDPSKSHLISINWVPVKGGLGITKALLNTPLRKFQGF